MKTLTHIALFLIAVSVGIHLYLSSHHYSLKLGASSGPSICSMNSTFDCDTVSMSAYSTFLGVPLSVWGIVANLFIFGALLLAWLQWTDHPERVKRFAVLLMGGSVVASVVMGAISLTMMSTYCLFCMALYVLSILSFLLVLKTLEEPFFAGLKEDIPHYFGESKGLLISLILIPALAFFGHRMYLSKYGGAEINTLIGRTMSSWQSNPAETIDTKPLLAMGPSREDARFVLSEFADLRCPHCKYATTSVHAFAKSHPDVRFEFYVFTLDGSCNSAIQSSSGLSCFLSKTLYCAEKVQKGWDVQTALFDRQAELNGLSLDGLQKEVKAIVAKTGANADEVFACSQSPEAQEAIEIQSKQGVQVNVQGTPSFYGNLKKLDYGQLIPVLEEARKRSQAK